MIDDINDLRNSTTDLSGLTSMFLSMVVAQFAQAKTDKEKHELLRELYALTQGIFGIQVDAMEEAITIDDFGAIFLADAKLNSDYRKQQKETE